MNMRSKALSRAAMLAGCSIAMLSTSQAFAQQAADDQGAATSDEDNVIIVSGVRGSILSSLDDKRDAIGFVDSISAEDLGKFPDLNLSESLQRIPGVTLTRNDFGDGASINLRGLGPNFTRIEVNGVTGTVNDARGGGFNFEILASELFSNATVRKSFSASDTEGGLAGLVQLSTPRAFDRDGFSFTASAQAQYAENADDFGPRAAVLLSQNWNDVFGITASIAYSDTEYLTSSNGGISARPLTAAATPALRASATQEQLTSVIPSTINFEVNNDARETIGATLGLQFRPSEKLTLTVDGIYAQINSDRRFTRADAPPESGISAIANDTISNGVITSATLTDVQNRVATNDQDAEEEFMQASASIEFKPNDNLTITPFVGYSSRELSNDAALLSFARGNPSTGRLSRFPVSYNLNGQFIEFSSPGLDLADPAIADDYFINVFLIRPTVDEDSEFSTQLDFRYDFDDSPISNVQFGGRYSRRETAREFIEVRVVGVAGTDLRTLPTLGDALVLEDFQINGAPSSFPTQIVSANPDAILDQYFVGGFDIDAFRTAVTGPLVDQTILGQTVPGSALINRPVRAAQETFSGEEKTLALYGEITFELDDFVLNAGVRYINTDQTSFGFSVANNFGTAVEVDNSYSEFLPSLSLRYEVQPDLIVRAAYSKSLTRPTLNDLRVAESFGGIDVSGGSGTRGNPELEPFTSDNLDLGLEWYFAPEGLLAISGFYKSVDGLIVSSTVTENREFLSQVTNQLVTGPIVFSLPANGERADIKGVEVIAQSRFTFLPGTLSNFGAIVNYTFADSDAAFVEGQPTSEVASIPGISRHSFNAILYYDDGALDARLSYAYRDRFVQSTAASFGVPEFQNARGQLDFSANYALTDQLTLQFQALNITKERLEIESILNVPNDTAQLDRRFFFGARYSF
jgi:iron complex outermembrane receptor protein